MEKLAFYTTMIFLMTVMVVNAVCTLHMIRTHRGIGETDDPEDVVDFTVEDEGEILDIRSSLRRMYGEQAVRAIFSRPTEDPELLDLREKIARASDAAGETSFQPALEEFWSTLLAVLMKRSLAEITDGDGHGHEQTDGHTDDPGEQSR